MKTILISGCAGFIGQNLVKKLSSSYNIIGVDNFMSSNRSILDKLLKLDNFKFIESDIRYLDTVDENIDYIFNLACPASPPKYQEHPIFTLETNFIGTRNLLKIAKKYNSVFIQASTSEIYGDPEINPQIETYRGNVNTMGERSCYDEGKRVAEALCYEFRKKFKVQTRVVRIFNTYGPGMDPLDGRVISNFTVNSINKKPITIYGDGSQTRSFCYVDDMVEALSRCMTTDFDYAINLGNESEISLNDLADIFLKKYGSPRVEYSEPKEDDPKIRKPNIERANQILKWNPTTSLSKGLDQTFKYFKLIVK
jgi:UDP-glucuronate decarboxylase